MKFILIFLISFVVGPALFWILAREQPHRRFFVFMWLSAIALIVTAVAAARWLVPAWAASPYPGLVVILALWLAWIVVLALCVQAVQLRARSDTISKGAFAVGAMSTTLPWFGLYIALLMGP